MEARQRGAINTRDDKQRQFFYRAAVTDRCVCVWVMARGWCNRRRRRRDERSLF